MRVKMIFCGLAYVSMVAAVRADAVDVMGVSTGMPSAELQQVFQKRGWRCEQVDNGFNSGFSCRPQDSGNLGIRVIKIHVGKFLPDMPVDRMELYFSTADNPIPSLVQKFGKPLPFGGDPIWELSNRSSLKLESGGTDHILILEDRQLFDANVEAQRIKASPYPTPKF